LPSERDHRELPVSPAIFFYLMVGQYPPRVPGWPGVWNLSQQDREAVWRAHRRDLLADGKAAGFTPWAARALDGVETAEARDEAAAREAWITAFVGRWGY